MEIWKSIQGYEGRYEVSNQGRVRSLFGRVRKLPEPKIMKGDVYKKALTSYMRVQLRNPDARVLVHRLVAEAFIENPNEYPLVNHLDNDGLNNNAINLQWCTQSQNLQHAQNQGRLTTAQQTGGYVASRLAKEAAVGEAKAMVGNTYGSRLATKVVEKSVSSGVTRIGLEVVCTCGDVQWVYYRTLQKGEASGCRACKKSADALVNIQQVVLGYKNKVLGTWLFTGEADWNDEKPTTKTLKLGGKCIVCGCVDTVCYAKLPKIKQCKNCK